jgi:hypothetical protein
MVRIWPARDSGDIEQHSRRRPDPRLDATPWSAREGELTVVAMDRSYILEGPPRPEDAAAHRVFALDPDAARFFGWTVEQAMSQPDSHYDEVIKRFIREWAEGRRSSSRFETASAALPAARWRFG